MAVSNALKFAFETATLFSCLYLKQILILAGVAGFEPTMRESKSLALPLGDTPILKLSSYDLPF